MSEHAAISASSIPSNGSISASFGSSFTISSSISPFTSDSKTSADSGAASTSGDVSCVLVLTAGGVSNTVCIFAASSPSMFSRSPNTDSTNDSHLNSFKSGYS